jgi:hypothetical protein
VDTPLNASVRRETVEGSATFESKARVQGDLLVLMIETTERCAIITTPQKTREIHVVKTADSTFMKTAWTFAVLGIALGAYSYLDAEGLAAKSLADDPSSTATPGSFRTMGLVIGGGGLFAGVVGIGNQMRAGNSIEDGGTIKDTPATEDQPCHRRPASDEPVTLRLRDGSKLASSTASDGRAEFSFTSLPLSSLPRAGEPLVLGIDGEERVRFTLSVAERDAIEAALAANPESRVAKDREERRRSDCRSAVGIAHESSVTSLGTRPDEILDQWGVAKQKCGDLWTAEDEAAAGAMRRKVAGAVCDRTIQDVDNVFDYGLDRREVARIEALIARAGEMCEDQDRLRGVRSRFSVSMKKLEEAERLEAERAALVDELDHVEDAMRARDAESAYRMLRANSRLRTVQTETTKELAWDLLTDSVDAVLSSQPSRAEAERRMCFSREVFKLVVGSAALRNAVQRFVNEVGTSDPAHAARVVRALKAGRCR